MKNIQIISKTLVLLFILSFVAMPFLNAQKKQLMPLSIGNYWNYDEDSVQVWQSKVERDTVVKGVKWYFLRNEGWYSNLSDGLYGELFSYQIDSVIKPQLVFPTAIGHHYRDFHDDSVVVLSCDTNIVVKRGEFRCYLYRIFPTETKLYHHFSPPLYIDVYCSPEVGIIKVERFDKRNGKIVRISYHELSEFKINK